MMGKTTYKYIGGVYMFSFRKSLIGAVFLLSLFTISQLALANQNYEDVNQFYKNTVNKEDYEEYSDSKTKVRELVIVRKLPDLIDTISWDYDEKIKLHLKEQIVSDSKSMNSEGLVYFFFSLKEDSNKVSYKYALYNPETKKLITTVEGDWRKKTR
jgi:predicted RND superfamily exporter protein